jgi:hypothetical protein
LIKTIKAKIRREAMQFKIPHDKNLLCTAVALSLLPLSGTSLAQDDQIEEVVVTGSFIRKSEGFTQASLRIFAFIVFIKIKLDFYYRRSCSYADLRTYK